MKKFYLGVLQLLVAAVVFQFYAAVSGVFQRPTTDSSFGLYRANGSMILPVICLLVIIAAALARAGVRTIALSVLPLVLLVFQTVLFTLTGVLTGSTEEHTTTTGSLLLGQHAVNGVAILAVSVVLWLRARALVRPAAGVPAAEEEPVGSDRPM